MPIELILRDLLGSHSQVVSQEVSEFFLFKGGVVVLVISLEDGLEVLCDEVLE